MFGHSQGHPRGLDDLTVQIDRHILAVFMPYRQAFGLQMGDVLRIVAMLSGFVGTDDLHHSEQVHRFDEQYLQKAVGGVGLGHRVKPATIKPAVARQHQSMLSAIIHPVDLDAVRLVQAL